MAKAKAKAKDSPAPEGAAKKGGKRKLLLIAAPVLLLGAGAGVWFSGLLGGGAAAEASAEGSADAHGAAPSGGHGAATDGHGTPAAAGGHGAPAAAGGHGAPAAAARPAVSGARGGPVFFEMPEMVANLNAPGRRSTFIRLRSRLELSKPEDAETVQQALPRLLDLFQTYLREMRPEELRGSMGTQRLREELIARATIAATPARVIDVLFTDILVQ